MSDTPGNRNQDMNAHVLDEALDALSDRAPEFANGNSNHAPMVAETLVAIGREDAVLRWVDAYRQDVPRRPAAQAAPQGDWREALGAAELWPGWAALFRRELAERPWAEVLDAWAARLAPGFSGEAMHGVIRTAHAARGLAAVETEPRLNELADALAYWAAGYHALPVSNVKHSYPLPEALRRVPAIDVGAGGNIDAALRRLGAFEEFAPVIDLLEVEAEPLYSLSQLSQHFAAMYLANAEDMRSIFALVHAVTGPSAVRLLAPHISEAATRLLMRYAWQAAAAVHAAFVRRRDLPPFESPAPEKLVLLDAAVDNGAAHAIKFVEACLREHDHNPTPVYLLAAADAASRLEG